MNVKLKKMEVEDLGIFFFYISVHFVPVLAPNQMNKTRGKRTRSCYAAPGKTLSLSARPDA